VNSVLLIEDDHFYCKQMVRALKNRFPALSIETAETAKKAKERIASKHYDLVIADLMLPDSDGGHVKELVETGQRVIVVTSHTDTAYKEKIFQLDIVDYIIKAKETRFEYLLKLIGRLMNNVDKTILVAEDAAAVRNLFRKFLSVQNLNVLTAADGREALEILDREKVDLVLSDYNMPNVDGLELLKEVRKKRSMLDLPFIAISAETEGDTVATFLKYGANDYLKKPFGKEELLCRINNTLDTLDMLSQIRKNATTDALTDLYNRHYFYEMAPKMLSGASALHEPLSIAIIDIDRFKRINDRHGHLFGDRVLRTIAKILKKSVRKSDILVRFGGEEFLIMMPNTTEKRAFVIMEKLRDIVANMVFPLNRSDQVRVTISSGIAEFENDMTLDRLIKAADVALYRAKESGRNRVEMYTA